MATTPDLHEAFWVAIATAAPVIGLASAVTAEQTARRSERAVERAQKEGGPPPRTPVVAYSTTYGNIMLQTAVLSLALSSLSFHQDRSIIRFTAFFLTVVGMALVFLPSWVSAVRTYSRAAAMARRHDAAAGGAGGAGGAAA
jgi:hypothetical protein